MIGYCLFDDYHIAKVFVFHGVGANGKTTLLNMITEFLGHNNVIELVMQLMREDSFLLKDLYGKMANIASELPNKKLADTGIIKAISGNTRISVDQKFLSTLSFTNHAKLIFACNKVPTVDDTSLGWLRRIILIGCPNVFSGQVNMTELVDGLKSEFPGLLNKALDALSNVLESGEFSADETTQLDLDKISDTVKFFVSTCVEEDVFGAAIPKSDVYARYVEVCDELDLNHISSAAFKDRFTKIAGFVRSKKVTYGSEGRIPSYVGLSLID